MSIDSPSRPGVELSRIVLVNWYGFSRLDIEVRGSIALIGRNGAGKSSVIDAIQLVLSGGNRRYFSPNASAEITSGASKKEERRSVLDYCLGSIDNRVLRPETISYVALVFRNAETGEVWTAGMGMSGREGDADVTDLGSFIAKGFDLSTDDFVRNGRTRVFAEFEDAIRKARGGGDVTFLRGRPGEFSSKLLQQLTGNMHLDAETYLRALKNSLAFKAMDDPTVFVRRYVLPPPGLSSSKIEGLRRSFSNWKAIEERIRKAAVEQEQVQDLSDKLTSLVEKRRETARWSMIEALAEEQVASEASDMAARKVRSAESEVEASTKRLAMSRAAITELDGAIALAKAELGEQKTRDEIEARRSDGRRADADVAEAEARRARIVTGLMGASALRPLIAEESEALEAGPVLAQIEAFSKAAERGDSLDRALAPLVRALDGFAAKAEERENVVRESVADLKAASAEDREALRRFRAGGNLLGARTSALVAELAAAGIVAEPLCSLVEVVDERWRDAAETLLGGAREALIVDPSKVSAAIRVVDEAGHRFQGCLIYDAKDGDRASPSAARGTLAAMLRTTNPYARAFLGIRIGNVRCVEDREELRAHNRAVTPSVMVKGGGAIYKASPPHIRLLGLTVQGESADVLERRIGQADLERSTLNVRVERLRRIAAGVADFLTAADSAAALGDVERAIIEAMNRSEAAQASIASLEKLLSSDRFEALRDLERDREGHVEDADEEQNLFKSASSAHGQAEERARTASARLATMEEKVASVRALVEEDVQAEAAELKARLVESRGDAAIVAREARAAIETAGGRIEQRLQAVRQEAANYARATGIDFVAKDGLDDLAAWIAQRLDALEGDVLAKYRDQAASARAEMERAIYDDFILNLANDLAMGRERVKYLNRALGAHRFNGERFAFTDAEHKDYADIVALSRAVLSSERRISDLFNPDPERAEDLSDREARGLARIRSIFEGGGDVDHFTDYRNYLTFDLVSYDAVTDQRIAGARERSKRSGGERQVPFYIAMASAMASVCYRGRKRGMGFAMFDEAFNALDNGNISASLAMMQQLGLQFLLSAPTEKASAFVPHVDTVINVSRHDVFCQIDVEYPKEKAKREMLARDPSISGIAALRRDAA